MRLVKASYAIRTELDGRRFLRSIEEAGRTCYKSEDRITADSAFRFVGNILRRTPPHESVIEHESISVRFTVDRGVSHELVRHRICAFSQESTRYCNYRGGVTFVIPPWVFANPGDYQTYSTGDTASDRWWNTMLTAEADYCQLIEQGWSPQQARSVLPNSLKTEIVCTANLREWRHILRLRTSREAHPQMREIMVPLLQELHRDLPVFFDDIPVSK